MDNRVRPARSPGHPPSPRARSSENAPRPSSVLALADLPDLLAGVRADLLGFLARVERAAGAPVAARLDEDLGISAP